MRKLLLFLLVLGPLSSLAQGGQASQGIKMFDFPPYSGNLSGFYLPIFDLNQNRMIDAGILFNNLLNTKSTSNLPEGTNQYFTEARARAAITVAGTGILFNPATGVFSMDFSTLDSRYTTNLTFDQTIKYSGETLGVDLSKIHRYTKVVADADYNITADDECIVLPDPSVLRNCNLPPASSMQGLTITIICAATALGEWILVGSFVQTATTGSSPFTENFSNSGLAPGQRLRLTSINDNGSWRWFDTY